MTDLQTTELNRDMKICSFDIENMYTNIPKRYTINIINNIPESNPEINTIIRKAILHILQTVMGENYSQIDQQYYKQTDGLAMGAPSSSILAETKYIQSLPPQKTNNHIFKIYQEIKTTKTKRTH
jgi:hypothetical protein